jgi:predicted nucleotidyltransferase
VGRGELAREDDPQVFDRVLSQTAAALETAGIDHVFFGTVATFLYGRPEPIGDIDVMIREADGEAALEALRDAGFADRPDDQTWLLKSTKDGVLVDLIFRAAEKFHLDDDVLANAPKLEFQGVPLPLLSPEDALVLAALATKVEAPEHWWIGLGIIARTPLDWEYVLRRARLGPRAVLGLLVFAHSEDLQVPLEIVQRLYAIAYGD